MKMIDTEYLSCTGTLPYAPISQHHILFHQNDREITLFVGMN